MADTTAATAAATTTNTTTTEPTISIAAEDIPREDTLLRKLNAAERYWLWKASLRGLLCVLNIVAIGCAAWILAHPTILDSNPFLYYFEFNDSALGALIVFCLSLIWCLVWITVPLFLRPPRPLHPGVAVGFDLIFWLGFLVVALFSLAGLFGIAQFGSDGSIPDPAGYNGYYQSSRNYSGSYYRASNGTWLYNITYTSIDYDTYHYNRTLGDYVYENFDPNTIVRDCTPTFTSCAEQDEFINALWKDKQKRFGIEVVINVVEWLGVLIHFAVFVWACVDTHRHNRSKHVSRDKVVADRIIADLERRGLIAVQNGVITQANPASQAEMSQVHSDTTRQLPPTPPRNNQATTTDAITSTSSPRWA